MRPSMDGGRSVLVAGAVAPWEASAKEAPTATRGRDGARRGGTMKSDWTTHLEDTAFALLAAAVLLGVPALTRLLGLG